MEEAKRSILKQWQQDPDSLPMEDILHILKVSKLKKAHKPLSKEKLEYLKQFHNITLYTNTMSGEQWYSE